MVNLLHHLLMVVWLHEVGDTTGASLVQHLLTVLAVLLHHLVVVLLLLLLQLVVESLELGTLIRGIWREDSVDILTERDLRAESVHLVVVRATRHSKVCHASILYLLLLLLASVRELIKVGRLLHQVHHAILGSTDNHTWIVAVTDRISLNFIDTASYGFNLNLVFNTLVHYHFVTVTLGCRRIWITIHAHKLIVPISGPLAWRTLLC